MTTLGNARAELTGRLDELAELYRDLHAHPELSMQEHRTAGLAADRLREQGFDVTTGVGGTGVVGVLSSGDGPTVLLRADMDALPVLEQTGLPYASTATGTDPDGKQVPLMHACGHDMHVTCLLGATDVLARNRDLWRGTVLAVFQPGEEIAAGATAMLDDGLLDRFGRPDVCLGQHVIPIPAGQLSVTSGVAMAAADSCRIRMFGQGGHGSMPHTTVDPVVMAAATVLRLQGLVAREVAPDEAAVVTVGSLQAGSKENIISDEAELKVNVRTFDLGVRQRVLDGIRRIAEAESAASNAPRPPEITELHSFPVTTNEPGAAAKVAAALRTELGEDSVHALPPVPASEDFGAFGTAANAPSVFWKFGGLDPAEAPRFIETRAGGGTYPPGVASNHSPFFAPVIHPTIEYGTRAMVAAARAWLAP